MKEKIPFACIIGAGPSGMVACKIFQEKGIPYDCFEASDKVGGLWNFNSKTGMSAAYRSLHINTSREKMAYSDFPMPSDYPDYPHHEQISRYFESYVDHFRFRDRITFNTMVTQAELQEDSTWLVELNHQESRRYDVLIVANGHHWDPAFPDPPFPGHFEGVQMHSHDYKDPNTPENCYGKNVVIVGMGNSAMDIACELGNRGIAKQVFLSIRTGTYIIPKYFGSSPVDELIRYPGDEPYLAERVLDFSVLGAALEKLAWHFIEKKVISIVGRPEAYGLPKPKHAFGQAHPTVSDEIHIRLGSGDVLPKPNISRLDGKKIFFEDDSMVDADVLILATGYKISFPFFKEDFFQAKENDIALFLRMLNPKHPNLLFLGLVQPICALMPVAEVQARWMAEYLLGKYHLPQNKEVQKERFGYHEQMKSKYLQSRRHTIQINCMEYTYKLWKELRMGRKRAFKHKEMMPVAGKVL